MTVMYKLHNKKTYGIVNLRRLDIVLWRDTNKILRKKTTELSEGTIRKYASYITTECFMRAMGVTPQEVIEARFDTTSPTLGLVSTSRRLALPKDSKNRCLLTNAKNYLFASEVERMSMERRIMMNNMNRHSALDERWLVDNTTLVTESVSGDILAKIITAIHK